MDFFDTHIKMTARPQTSILSQDPFMSEHYKYPKKQIFQKVGRFPQGNYSVEILLASSDSTRDEEHPHSSRL